MIRITFLTLLLTGTSAFISQTRTRASFAVDPLKNAQGSAGPTYFMDEAVSENIIQIQVEPVTEQPEEMKTTPVQKAPKKVVKKGGAHNDGIFTPAVLVAKTIMGDDQLIKFRAKVISYHSDIIKDFVETHKSPFGQTVLTRAFVAFDKNRDGTIDKEELSTITNFLGFSWLQEKQINGIMKRADLDKNGVLDEEEFKKEAPKVFKNESCEISEKERRRSRLSIMRTESYTVCTTP